MRFFDLFRKKKAEPAVVNEPVKAEEPVKVAEPANEEQIKAEETVKAKEPLEPAAAVSAKKEQPVPVYSKEEAINSLRKKIIAYLEKEQKTQVHVATLMWKDAARCFPDSYAHWDGAWFHIDLTYKEHVKLYADVDTYPNQYGANRSERKNLSAQQMHEIVMEYKLYEKPNPLNLANELCFMKTQGDWDALRDKALLAATETTTRLIAEKEQREAEERRFNNAVVIPDQYAGRRPKLVYSEILLTLSQHFGGKGYAVTVEDGKYVMRWAFHMNPAKRSERGKVLTDMQATWLEDRVQACLDDPGTKEWRSLAGGDFMVVKICKGKKVLVDIYPGKPLEKYMELHQTLEKLWWYGSLTEAEARQLREKLKK